MSSFQASAAGGTPQPFQPRASLWEAVVRLCPEQEAGEVRRALGASLVEQARDLREEAKSLLEVWRVCRDESDESLMRSPQQPSLPEPPAVRERLVKEIDFFVGYLKQKSRPIPTSSGESSDVLDYVTRPQSGRGSRCGSVSGCGRASSAVSWSGRDTPLRDTPSSGEGSKSSILDDTLAAKDVNAEHIDSILCHLRLELAEECELLQEDIDFLHQAIEEEVDVAGREKEGEPSLQELREFGSRLEQAVLMEVESSPRSPPLPLPPPARLPPLTPSPPPLPLSTPHSPPDIRRLDCKPAS